MFVAIQLFIKPHIPMHRHMPRLTQMTMAMSWALTMPTLCQIGVSQKTDQQRTQMVKLVAVASRMLNAA